MALTAAEADRAEWSGRRGDDIERSWTRTSGGTGYDAGSLVVQIRAGSRESDALVASSDPEQTSATCALIELVGTDLAGDPAVIAWQCAKTEYEKIPAGARYWIGFDVTVDGKAREIQRHQWVVTDQTAVRSAP